MPTHAAPLAAVQDIALIVLLALAAGCAAYWLVVLWHIWRTVRRLPTARQGLALPAAENLRQAGPAVCIVIPAHNEQRVIAGLARSLAEQDYPNLRVVFSLDRCTDGTHSVVREAVGGDARFAVHAVTQCPADWAGKVHAIHSAVKATTAAQTAELLRPRLRARVRGAPARPQDGHAEPAQHALNRPVV
jgi:cellulose synthase/poly-beta-1,6-N-acetylglucosamine synthase-like glycosyltransferase